MKKLFFIGLISFLNYSAFGQTNTNEKSVSAKKFEISITPKLGFGKITETGSAPLNGFVNGGEALISTKISKSFNLAAGLQYFEFTGNTTLFVNTSSLTNSYLQIPLKINGDLMMANNNVYLTYGFGIYGNTLLKQKIENDVNSTSKNNLGWSLGFSSQLGVRFKLSDLVNVGFGYESQGDLSKMRKNNVERKIDNLNFIYFTLAHQL